MAISEWFGFSKAVTEPVNAVGNALDNLFTSDEEKLTKQEILERTRQNPTFWQKSLDVLNAKSKVWFVAAARPFCVWVAGLNIASLNIAIWMERNIPEWYADMSVTAFLGALGLYGVSRTVEKIKDKSQ